MVRYITARLIDVVIVAVLSLTAVFGMLRLTGDPINVLTPMDATGEQRAELTHQLGLNKPLYVLVAHDLPGRRPHGHGHRREPRGRLAP